MPGPQPPAAPLSEEERHALLTMSRAHQTPQHLFPTASTHNPASYGCRYPLRIGDALAIMLVYSLLLDYDVAGLRTGAVNEKGEQRPSRSTPRGGMPWRPPYETKRLSSYS